ncbi:hypothetical protein PAI11_44390 [Patulibacter medicamentivorans]|uniref:Htaa domain-containing protein n=1 Tax=Patulibacter medicamentivorans TaxID=1097667 RepID=H0EC61_9ACTN|nr:HtaA domain-containing protein [Patulibacter medicamentivorans]EHN08733.1 hypothetical protein PAI11_44390 [Patulibacter medicamentivorans]
MSTISRTSRLSAALGATLVLALAVPAVSSATIPGGVTSANWNVRNSWVNYLTNPAWSLWIPPFGSVTATANTPAAGDAAPSGDPAGGFSTHDGTTPFGYVFTVKSDAGSPRTVTLKGGLDFDLPAHGIDISLKNVRVVANGSGEQLKVDATYVPLAGSTVSAPGIVLGNVSSAGAVTLTAAGATVFNGGSNGSYSAGDAFGTVAYGS